MYVFLSLNLSVLLPMSLSLGARLSDLFISIVSERPSCIIITTESLLSLQSGTRYSLFLCQTTPLHEIPRAGSEKGSSMQRLSEEAIREIGFLKKAQGCPIMLI